MKQSYKSFDAIGINYSEYEKWCLDNKKNPKRKNVKEEFFRLILDGKLIKENGKLVKKRTRKKEKEK